MKIHKGDKVQITTGKYKGKEGQVVRVLKKKNRVVVEGVNEVTRHLKVDDQGRGGRTTITKSIDVSNVAYVGSDKKITRIGYKIDPKTNKKVRIEKSTNKEIKHTSK